MRLILSIALCVAAAACAYFDRQMTVDVNEFVGRDIHIATARLGPAKEETIAGDHLYRWSVNGGSTALAQSTPNTCAIDLVVNEANIVTSAKWVGDKKGCGALQDRIEND